MKIAARNQLTQRHGSWRNIVAGFLAMDISLNRAVQLVAIHTQNLQRLDHLLLAAIFG